MNLCERFPSLTPFQLRREKASEVFLLVKRMNNYNKKSTDKNKPKKIRKKAGDNWF